MEMLRGITGRFLELLSKRPQNSQPSITNRLILPSGVPLELDIAHRLPLIENDLENAAKNKNCDSIRRLSLGEMINFFGLQLATWGRDLSVVELTSQVNFDFDLAESDWTNAAMRVTRFVKISDTKSIFKENGKPVEVPYFITTLTRLMRVQNAEQAGIIQGGVIDDEISETFVLARWSEPRLPPDMSRKDIIYSELYFQVDRKSLFTSRRYGSLWEVSIGFGESQIDISPKGTEDSQRQFRLDFDGRVIDR